MDHIHKFGISRIETNKSRHSLEEQLSRVQARDPLKEALCEFWSDLEEPEGLSSLTCPTLEFSRPHIQQYEPQDCAL